MTDFLEFVPEPRRVGGLEADGAFSELAPRDDFAFQPIGEVQCGPR